MDFKINQPQVSEGKKCYEDKDLLVDGGGANKFDQVGLICFEKFAPF